MTQRTAAHNAHDLHGVSMHVIYTRVEAYVRLWMNGQVLQCFRRGICFSLSRIILSLSTSFLSLALLVFKTGSFGIGGCLFR